MKIKKIVTLMMGLSFSLCIFAQDDWQLVWSDEFDTDGSLNSSVWNFEQGYARNEEAQWYQSDNAVCKNGLLIIEARKEQNRKILFIYPEVMIGGRRENLLTIPLLQ